MLINFIFIFVNNKYFYLIEKQKGKYILSIYTTKFERYAKKVIEEIVIKIKVKKNERNVNLPYLQ